VDTKAVNQQNAADITRVPLHLVPAIISVESSMAFLEGALKYGVYNWREVPVSSSSYFSAARRHLDKWWSGEDYDQKTRVHHFGSAIASLGIVLDATLVGTLVDDRPAAVPLPALIDSRVETIQHLQTLFGRKS
jgi:hypothetical protein